MGLHAVFKSVLILVQVLLHGQSLAVEPQEVPGILGRHVPLLFKFQNNYTDIHNANIYKDDKVIHSCDLSHSASSKMNICAISKINTCVIAAKTILFCIITLKSEDSGMYWAAWFKEMDPPVISSKLSLCIQMENNTTASPPINSTSTSVGESPYPMLFSPLVILTMLGGPITVLLAGLLGWFCWTQRRNSDPGQQEKLNDRSQVPGEASNPTAVYSVEYGVLDFHSQPRRAEETTHNKGMVVRSTDTVEYAIVTFQPRPELVGDRAD